MYMIVEVSQYVAVASFSEAWIEIAKRLEICIDIMVASFSEAWIEILLIGGRFLSYQVASFSEAWWNSYNSDKLCGDAVAVGK